MPAKYRRMIVKYPLRQALPPAQPTLDRLPPPPAVLSISERFEAFHRDNPEIYELLHHYALAAAAEGRVSVKAIYERVRFETRRKLDNSFTAPYARLLFNDPRLAPFIELRTRKSE
jgi:hypothetical protein